MTGRKEEGKEGERKKGRKNPQTCATIHYSKIIEHEGKENC